MKKKIEDAGPRDIFPKQIAEDLFEAMGGEEYWDNHECDQELLHRRLTAWKLIRDNIQEALNLLDSIPTGVYRIRCPVVSADGGMRWVQDVTGGETWTGSLMNGETGRKIKDLLRICMED